MKTTNWLIKGVSYKKLLKERREMIKYSEIPMKTLYRIYVLSPVGDSLGYIDCVSLKEVKNKLDDPMTSFNHSLIISVCKRVSSYRRVEIYIELAGSVMKDLKKFSGKYVKKCLQIQLVMVY